MLRTHLVGYKVGLSTLLTFINVFFPPDDILKHNSLQDVCLLNYIFIWYFL